MRFLLTAWKTFCYALGAMVVAVLLLQGWFFAPETVAGLEFADLIASIREFHGLPGNQNQT